MISLFIDIGLIIFSLSTLSMAWRIIQGPTLPDRVVAADGAVSHVIGLTLLVGMKMSNPLFFDIAIAFAILSFFSSVIVGKYIAKGTVIDVDLD